MENVELNFLGIGAYSNPELGNTSVYFCLGSDLVLIDCGESVFASIKKKLDSDQIKRVLVLVTHMHNDHAGSLGTLVSYCAYVIHKPVEIFHPSDRIQKYLDIIGIDRKIYKLHMQIPTEWAFSITPHKVTHTTDMECFGYEISVEKNVFYFSGDANDIPDDVLKKFLDRQIKNIYNEVTMAKESSSHCSISLLEKKIPMEERNRFFCMHIPDKNDIVTLTQKGFQIPKIK